MNAQQQEQEPAVPDSGGSSANSPGELLRAAREHAGLQVMNVASDLHLDTCMIEAIEANNFKALGAPVYAKGYLRKYARLVGLTDDSVLHAYERCSDVPRVSDPVPSNLGQIPEGRRPLPGWAWWSVAALILVAIAVTLLQLRGAAEQPSADIASTSTTLASNSDAADQAGANENVADVGSQDDLAEPTTSAEVADATESPAAAAKRPEPGQLNLRLSFKGDSWVEIYDARNNKVFYDLGRSSDEREVQAVAPLRVLFGSAANVSLSVNGRVLSIPTNKMTANTARFVLRSDGTIE